MSTMVESTLIEHIEVDPRLRNLCGWINSREIPSESTFSRAFAEFAESDLAGRMNEALIKERDLYLKVPQI